MAIKSSDRNSSLAVEFKEGWNYVRSNNIVLLIIFLAAWIGFFGFPFGQQIPAIARDVLHQFADTEAIIQTRTSALYFAQGIGALISALFIAAFSTINRKGLLMTIGQFVFAIGLVLISFTRNIPVTLVLIGVLGMSMVTQMMMMNTLIQLDVPDLLRGRVFSVYLWAVQGVAPFGSLFIGGLAQTAGIPRTALVGGITCLLAIVYVFVKWPILRKHIG
jgi:MFS family permease